MADNNEKQTLKLDLDAREFIEKVLKAKEGIEGLGDKENLTGLIEVATFLAFISDDQQFVQKEHGVKTVSLPVSSIADVNLVEFPEYNQHVRNELLKTTDMWGIIHDEKSLCFTEVSISAVENWLQLNSETIEYKQQTISLEHIKCILQHIKESKTSRPNSSIDATWVRVDGDYIEAVSMWDDGTLIKFDNTTKDVK